MIVSIVSRFVGTQHKQSKYSGFRPELFRHTIRAVCEKIVKYARHYGFNPAWKATWLRWNADVFSRYSRFLVVAHVTSKIGSVPS